MTGWRHPAPPKMNQVDAAWTAGLFEGEGCIGGGISKGKFYPRLVLQMTDQDVVARFQATTGVGTLRENPPSVLGTKPLYRWTTSGWLIVPALYEQWAPFLGTRRIEAFTTTLTRRTA